MSSDKLDAAREQLQAERTAKKSGNESYIAGQNQAFDRAIEIVAAAAQNTWHDTEKDGLPKKEGWYWWTRPDGKVVKIMYYYDGPEDDEDNRNVFGHMLAWRPVIEPQPYRRGE